MISNYNAIVSARDWSIFLAGMITSKKRFSEKAKMGLNTVYQALEPDKVDKNLPVYALDGLTESECEAFVQHLLDRVRISHSAYSDQKTDFKRLLILNKTYFDYMESISAGMADGEIDDAELRQICKLRGEMLALEARFFHHLYESNLMSIGQPLVERSRIEETA